jgi:SAM-dependent methyltransferase
MSEYHSGYRSYKCSALESVPFSKNSSDFHFDAEIILQFAKAGLKIKEVPIPTFYGDEICYVNGFRYALDCVKAAVKFRLMDNGVFFDPKYDVDSNKQYYTVKQAETSLHHYVRSVDVPKGARIADIGGGDGAALSAHFAEDNFVVCVDAENVRTRTAGGVEMVSCDLEGEWSFYNEVPFDVVFALDVLEQLHPPEKAVAELFRITKAGGYLYASVGNVGYFIPRVMLMFGAFNYSSKGILDLAHKRLLTFYTFRRLLENAGFKVEKIIGFGPPLKDLHPDSAFFAFADAVASKLARCWPSMFAFSFLAVCERPDSVDDLTRKTFDEVRL